MEKGKEKTGWGFWANVNGLPQDLSLSSGDHENEPEIVDSAYKTNAGRCAQEGPDFLIQPVLARRDLISTK